MLAKFYSTGEAAQMLGVKARDLSYAITRNRAGQVLFVGGRAALSPANVRELARHFGRPYPTCCREGEESGGILDPDIRQQGAK